MVSRAKELGMTALALTDHGALYGAIEFYEECKKQGIKPIIGMEAYIAANRMTDKRPKIDAEARHLTLLAKNLTGYHNLIKLTSRAHLEGFYYRPRVDHECLREHHEGLIALSGCLSSEIARALMHDDPTRAKRILEEYLDIFGKENFYIELQIQPELPIRQLVNDRLITLAREYGLQTVATKDSHYLDPADAEAQDILLCVQMGKTVDDPTRLRMRDSDYSLASPHDMQELFAAHPEAIANTERIAALCNLELSLGKWNFASIELPPGKSAEETLTRMATAGLEEKITITPEVQERLRYELDIICSRGFAPYFLAVSDYVNWARRQGIMATTRGSAAGSVVAYGIGITTVNPFIFRLPFERFLNRFRPSPPDIDMDFADNRRDEVIAYVTEKYGADKVAQICTFGTMMARGAVRDISRALGYPYVVGDRISKMIPFGSQGFPMTIAKAKEITPELASAYQNEPDTKRILDLAERIEGCARHVSVHAAGVVIAPRPLTDFTPVARESGGEKIITQYDMHAVEAAGLLKMDFLGIRNLSILGGAVEIIKARRGVTIDLLNLPLDDAKTFALLAKGDTTGLFQLGGSGMTRYLKELEPSSIFDIMAMVALYRPGPIESIPEFVSRKHHPKRITYLDPRMKPILEQSYGVITYQDDVLLIAIEIAGYSWEEADKLRKAIGKKIPAEMMKQKEKFISGCISNGLAEDKAHELWRLIEPFAAYGFNKAHAASYAMVAYQTAYLKANFPAEFMLAVLQAEAGILEKIAVAVAECKAIGLAVLPPDVNRSLANFSLESDTVIRFGLLSIKNLGSDIIGVLVAEREADGLFRDLEDFTTRLQTRGFNKKSLEALIKSGAMDSLGERNMFLENIEDLLAANRHAGAEAASGQVSLFGLSTALGTIPRMRLRAAPPAARARRLAWERELLGLYLTEHPFEPVARVLGAEVLSIGRLPDQRKGESVVVGGLVAQSKRVTTKKGEIMCFVRLEDLSGGVEAMVFPGTFSQNQNLWREGALVLVRAKISDRDEEVRLLVDTGREITPENALATLSELMSSQRTTSHIQLPTSNIVLLLLPVPPTPDLAAQLKTIFSKFPGTARVHLKFPNGKGERVVQTPFRVIDTPDLHHEVMQVVDQGKVVV